MVFLGHYVIRCKNRRLNVSTQQQKRRIRNSGALKREKARTQECRSLPRGTDKKKKEPP